ncbi:erythromycin esterase family protein [Kaistella flava (ex Peng et al. 2021)]|uniref:Erythromycin esterase family protein n=1 Tax=Kaistella flava (ex Peng et al. 2021) TaxID=2038776 RepID=A0A7M2YC50_9FLAO|nr:erythromycin esterase family protein [Kaistella flava (ex Peng et al. 2021)]QOW11847.1 erythromycin esterase family protein [Kaistella flava (ex Peng et al. 2021)]
MKFQNLQNKFFIILAFTLLACSTTLPTNKNTETVKIAAAKTIDKAIPYYPLENEKDLDVLLNAINDARVVLLGESTHGTHEYYKWSEEITKRLVTEKGFNLVLVEGDWADSYKVNQFIKGPLQDSIAAVKLLKVYDRWPEYMWGNYEIASMIFWLNQFNQEKADEKKVGFYGLDLYSFWDWSEPNNIVKDTILINAEKKVRKTFTSYNNSALTYSRKVEDLKVNHQNLTENLSKIITERYGKTGATKESTFLMQQEALLALEGERYFRTMVTNRQKSWNIRDTYMAETIKRILLFYGENAKAVIWIHNAHSGDVDYSNMKGAYTSVGKILKNELGSKQVFTSAFGTYEGYVMTGYPWYSTIKKNQPLSKAKKGSWEYVLHELGPENKILISKDFEKNHRYNQSIPFRSVGASFSGTNEVYGTSIIPKRYDAFLYIDSTTALHPITR